MITPTPAQQLFLSQLHPRFVGIVGEPGVGKTMAGLMKTVLRAEQGCSGAIIARDLPNMRRMWHDLKKLLAPVLLENSEIVRLSSSWQPYGFFSLHFTNGAYLHIGEVGNPCDLSGSQYNFAYLDNPDLENILLLKVINGKCRVQTKGISPQIWFSTRELSSNWVYPGVLNHMLPYRTRIFRIK